MNGVWLWTHIFIKELVFSNISTTFSYRVLSWKCSVWSSQFFSTPWLDRNFYRISCFINPLHVVCAGFSVVSSFVYRHVWFALRPWPCSYFTSGCRQCLVWWQHGECSTLSLRHSLRHVEWTHILRCTVHQRNATFLNLLKLGSVSNQKIQFPQARIQLSIARASLVSLLFSPKWIQYQQRLGVRRNFFPLCDPI